MISLFLDSNAWDLFFERKIDLYLELPGDEFSIQITREAEFEILCMPTEKRQYVETVFEAKAIPTDMYFGFYDESLPLEQQRFAGFNCGRFASDEELTLLCEERSSLGSTKRPTGLYKNEADVSLAARSMVSAVVTCDGKKVIKRAKTRCGGAVIDLKKWTEGSLAAFIRVELSNSDGNPRIKIG